MTLYVNRQHPTSCVLLHTHTPTMMRMVVSGQSLSVQFPRLIVQSYGVIVTCALFTKTQVEHMKGRQQVRLQASVLQSVTCSPAPKTALHHSLLAHVARNPILHLAALGFLFLPNLLSVLHMHLSFAPLLWGGASSKTINVSEIEINTSRLLPDQCYPPNSQQHSKPLQGNMQFWGLAKVCISLDMPQESLCLYKPLQVYIYLYNGELFME